MCMEEKEVSTTTQIGSQYAKKSRPLFAASNSSAKIATSQPNRSDDIYAIYRTWMNRGI